MLGDKKITNIILSKDKTTSVINEKMGMNIPDSYKFFYELKFSLRYPYLLENNITKFRDVTVSLIDLGLVQNQPFNDSNLVIVYDNHESKYATGIFVDKVYSKHNRYNLVSNEAHIIRVASDKELTYIDVPDKLSTNPNDFELVDVSIEVL